MKNFQFMIVFQFVNYNTNYKCKCYKSYKANVDWSFKNVGFYIRCKVKLPILVIPQVWCALFMLPTNAIQILMSQIRNEIFPTVFNTWKTFVPKNSHVTSKFASHSHWRKCDLGFVQTNLARLHFIMRQAKGVSRANNVDMLRTTLSQSIQSFVTKAIYGCNIFQSHDNYLIGC